MLPTAVRDVLKQKGDLVIKKIFVCRVPISSNIINLGNLISNNKLDNIKEKLGYDKLYHLFMVLKLEDNTLYLVEKNEVIVLKQIDDIPDNTEVIKINMKNRVIPLDALFENTIKLMGLDKFLKYDVANNNCQFFIVNILKANGLLTPAYNKFISQNIVMLFRKLGKPYKIVVDFVTNFFSKTAPMVKGSGLYLLS